MDIPNDASNTKTRIRQAKEWLKEHPEESITTVLRIFKVNRTSLMYAIQKAKDCSTGEGNRILTPGQEKSLNQFIWSYLDHGLCDSSSSYGPRVATYTRPTRALYQNVVLRLPD